MRRKSYKPVTPMQRLMECFGIVLAVAVVVGIISLAVLYEFNLWKECRRDHSFFYCYRVLDK